MTRKSSLNQKKGVLVGISQKYRPCPFRQAEMNTPRPYVRLASKKPLASHALPKACGRKVLPLGGKGYYGEGKARNLGGDKELAALVGCAYNDDSSVAEFGWPIVHTYIPYIQGLRRVTVQRY